MTDRGGGVSSLPYTPAGMTGSDDDDDCHGGLAGLTNPRRPVRRADFGLPLTRAGSANQNVADNFPREKPEERPPCFAHKLNEA